MLDRWNEIKPLFHEAMSLGPEERQRFVASACGNDLVLERAVRTLVRQAEVAAGEAFLEESPIVSSVDSELAIGRLVGRYRILGPIGSGGMGTVHLAEPVEGLFAGERLALKLIDADLQDIHEFYRRFRDEAKSLVHLRGTSVVTILDSGITDDALPYIVMEYVEGLPLDVYCDKSNLTLERRLRLFHRVCSAVNEAHRSHIVHRDLKPQHILIGQQETVRLIDFGIAKALSNDAAPVDDGLHSHRILSFRYASPEHVLGLSATPATDVYSLGVILFELLTGTQPLCLEQLSERDKIRVISEEVPPRPSEVAHRSASDSSGSNGRQFRLPPDLDAIVSRALHKTPSERYASAADLGDDIDRFLRNFPVNAYKGGGGYRARKFSRRHPIQAALGVLIILLAAAGTWAYSARESSRIRSRLT